MSGLALALASVLTLGDVDDARACTPLSNGGFAAATGAGLVLVEKDLATPKTLTSLDGLPETRVHAVVEQGDGVWVGTEAGAAYVSGGKVARTALSAPVSAVHVSPNGAVWLGTRGQGVYRLAAKDAAPVLVQASATGTRATSIAEKDGVVFVAYADGPVARVENGTLKPLAGSPMHGQALGVSGDAIVVGDLAGLYRFDDKGFTSIGSIDARSIAQASNGSSLLFGTYGSGVMSGNVRGAQRSDNGAGREVRGVGVRGAARCAATTSGLFVDSGTGVFTKVAVGSSLPSNDVTAMAADASGKRVAVGTFDRGAAIVENGKATRIAGIERTETINGLAWQGDKLWLATAHGLYRVDANGARRFTSNDGLPSGFTRAIAVIDASKILVGTESGPAIVEGDRITALVVDKKGGASPIASPMHATWAVAVRGDGTMFIGTAAGLYYGKDGRFERASLASGHLEDDWVTALAIDGANDVYVGTYSKGVTHLHFDGPVAKEPKATHLGGGYVNPDGLVVDGGKLWAATMEHLLVRAKNDDAASWDQKRSAAPGRDVTAVRFVDKRMWVASRRGVAVTP